MEEVEDKYSIVLTVEKDEMPMIFIHKDEPRIHICSSNAKYDKVFTWKLHVADLTAVKKE